ncbi:MAG: hypothetical protein JXR94_22170 [Candidatus Hydrogenedentes bacterium]|nr:hypothetical protein [Candidatus Hydrogenedentota bacterium]
MKHVVGTSKAKRLPIRACEEGGDPQIVVDIDIMELIDQLVCQIWPEKEKCA